MGTLAALLALAGASPATLHVLGSAPIAPAGSQAAPLEGEGGPSPWRYALSTGVAGKLGGMPISSTRENSNVLLHFGAQADGRWPEGRGQGVRLRIRMFTGGERGIYVPSDGDAEAAFVMGRPELRFVIGRVELARHPGLGIQTLAQLATLPSVEGTLALAGDTVRIVYQLSPVEAAWVYYHGDAHIPHSAAWATESDGAIAASAGRLRGSVLLLPGLAASFQGDLMKAWRRADLFASAEGSLAYPLLDRAAALHVTARWSAYTRRGLVPESSEREAELVVFGGANLVF